MNNLWLGSQLSYEAMLEAQALARANYGDKPEQPLPALLSVQGSVGIIDIRGSLVNGRAGFMSYFGVTGYGDIRDALAAAVSKPEISAILLNIDSGGGAVAGVHETAQLIARVDKIKPVISYNGGTEASAALWLGSSARKSYVAETALTGSLGIIMVHAERSKQLEEEGIKVTVIRAGSEKGLANPYEPLTGPAKEALESKAKAMYDVFLGHVAAQRGVSAVVADKQFGQGREFVGKQAVEAGLADAVGTLEDAFTKAAALGAKVAKPAAQAYPRAGLAASAAEVLATDMTASTTVVDNPATNEGTSMPKPLTQEHLAAMAAGVTLESADATAVTNTDAAPAASAATDAAAAVADTTAAPTAEATKDPMVGFLQAQVKDLNAELLTAKMAAKTAEDGLAASKANLEALTNIARASIRTMTIGLGGKAEAVDAMSTADVVAEHARVSAVFKDKFKVGAVAATNTSEDKPVVKAAVSPLFLSAVSSLVSK